MMAERALYHVAGLTRPARLRCRPALRSSKWHRTLTTTAARGNIQRKSDKIDLSYAPLKGVERRDYEDALELARRNGTLDSRSPEHGGC